MDSTIHYLAVIFVALFTILVQFSQRFSINEVYYILYCTSFCEYFQGSDL